MTEKHHMRTQLKTEVSKSHGVTCLRDRERLVQHGAINAPPQLEQSSPARRTVAQTSVNRQWRVWHETRVRPTDCIRTTSEAEHVEEKWHKDVAGMVLLQQE